MYTMMTPPVAPPAGYVISGLMQIPTAPLNRLLLSRADLNGNVPGAPFFNNMYTLFSPTGVLRSVNDAKVTELPNAQGFAIAGTCTENGTGVQYVYYMRAAANGAVINPVVYYRTSDQQYRVNGVRLAPNGNFVYIVGETVTQQVQRFFVIKVTLAGNLVWGNTYVSPVGNYFERGFDVLESVAPNPNVVAVVGTSRDANGNTDGFFVPLNPANGGPAGVMNLYGTNNSYDHFYSLDDSQSPNMLPSNPNPCPFGYVIGGYSNAGSAAGANDSWVLRIDNTYTLCWSRLIDYNGSGVSDECRDVVENRNVQTGFFQYYAGGNTLNGVLGGPDMIVNKLDAGGAMIWEGTYGNQGNQVLSTVDENRFNSDVSLYGTTQPGLLGASDMCIFNVNLNGNTACDDSVHHWLDTDGPKLNSRKETLVREPFNRTTGTAQFTPYSDAEYCWAPVVVPFAPKSGDAPSMQLDIYGTGEHSVTLEISGAEAAPAELIVTDISGRVLYTGNVTLQEGTTLLPVDLTAQVSNGIYLITVRQGAMTTTRKVLIVK